MFLHRPRVFALQAICNLHISVHVSSLGMARHQRSHVCKQFHDRISNFTVSSIFINFHLTLRFHQRQSFEEKPQLNSFSSTFITKAFHQFSSIFILWFPAFFYDFVNISCLKCVFESFLSVGGHFCAIIDEFP